MNPVLLQFANGATFFVGMAMVALGLTGLLRWRNPIARVGLMLAVVAGIALAVLSATPFPWWLYGVWGGAVLAAMTLGEAAKPTIAKTGDATAVSVVLLSVGLCIAEDFHPLRPACYGGPTP